MLKADKLPFGREILKTTREVKEKLVKFGTRLCLVDDPPDFHLMVDYRSKGCVYALFAGSKEDCNLVGLNSKGGTEKAISSYLGELKGI